MINPFVHPYLVFCNFSVYGSCQDITPERYLTTTIRGSVILLSSSFKVTFTLGGRMTESCDVDKKPNNNNNK